MNSLFKRLATLPPVWVLLSHAVLLIVMAIGISKLSLRNNDDADLPADDPIVQTNDRFEAIFGSKDRVLVSLESDDAFSLPSLTATREIANAFVGLPWVVGNEIKSLATIKNIEGTDEGLEVGTLYGAEALTPEVAAAVRHHATSNPLIDGFAVSEDGKASLILINVVRGSNQAEVFEDTYRILEPYRSAFKVRIIGDLILSEAIDRGIQTDALVLFPLAVVIQLIVLFLVFRNTRLVLASVVTTIIGIVWTMGLQGWMGYPITVVTTSIPILIAITAGSYAIYVVQTLLEERPNQASTVIALAEAMAKVAFPLVIACLTSAVGAISLLVFKVTAIAELGVVTGIGTIAALIVVVTLLPTLLRGFEPAAGRAGLRSSPAGAQAVTQWSQRQLTRMAALSMARPSLTLAGYAAVLIFSLVALGWLRTGANFADYLPDGHPIKTDMAYFDARLGGSRYFDLLIEAPEQDGVQDPRFLQRVEAIQNYAESLPNVGKTMSFVDVLKRIDAVIQNRTDGQIPESFEQAAQYLLLYSISSSPEDFSDLVDYDNRRVKVYIPVKTSEQEAHVAIYEQLKTFAAGLPNHEIHVEYGGNLLVWLAQMDYIIVGKIQNIISSVVMIFLLCAIFFRSWRYALLATIPISLAILATFALMAVVGIRLEVSTAVITGITIGIGIDFAYHFLYHYRSAEARHPTGAVQSAVKEAIHNSGPAILFTIAVTVFGFAAFLFSTFTPIQNFGYLVGINMLFSGLATFTMIPAMLAWRFRHRAQPTLTTQVAADAGY